MATDYEKYLNWGNESGNDLKGMAGTQFGKKLLKDALLADHKNFVGFTPHTTGRFFIFVTKMPTVCELLVPSATEIFRKLIQFYTIEVTGFSDLTMNTVSFDTGSELSSIDVPVGVTGETKELQISFSMELRDHPITKFIAYWFRAIFDNGANAGTYYGLVYQPEDDAEQSARKTLIETHKTNYSLSSPVYIYDDDGKTATGLEYDAANHTMSFIYFTTNQARSKIERIAYVVGGYPKTLPIQASLDSTWGQSDVTKPVLQLGCQVHVDNASVRSAVKAAGLESMIRGTMSTDFVFYKEDAAESGSLPIRVDTSASSFKQGVQVTS